MEFTRPNFKRFQKVQTLVMRHGNKMFLKISHFAAHFINQCGIDILAMKRVRELYTYKMYFATRG